MPGRNAMDTNGAKQLRETIRTLSCLMVLYYRMWSVPRGRTDLFPFSTLSFKGMLKQLVQQLGLAHSKFGDIPSLPYCSIPVPSFVLRWVCVPGLGMRLTHSMPSEYQWGTSPLCANQSISCTQSPWQDRAGSEASYQAVQVELPYVYIECLLLQPPLTHYCYARESPWDSVVRGPHKPGEEKRDGSVRVEGIPSTRRPLIMLLDFTCTHLCSAYTGWNLQDVLLHVHYMWHQVLLSVTKPQNGRRKQMKKKLVRKSLWNQKLVCVTKVTGWHHICLLW